MSVEKNLLFDRITLALSFALVCGGVALFQYNPLSIIPLRDLKPIATISNLQFESKRKMPGTLSWLKAHKSDTLYQGDQILTDEKSSVTVVFKSGSKLLISPQSLIRIETINDEYQIFLVKGELKLEGQEKLNIIDTQSGKAIQAKDNLKVSSTPLGLVAKESKPVPKPQPKIVKEINILNIRQGLDIDPNVNDKIEFDFSQDHTGTVITATADGRKVNTTNVANSLTTSIAMLRPGRYTTTVLDNESQVVGKASFRVMSYNPPVLKPIPSDTVFTKGKTTILEWSGLQNVEYKLEVDSPAGSKQFMVQANQIPVSFQESGLHTIRVSMIVGDDLYPSEKLSLDIKLQDGITIPAEELNQTIALGNQSSFHIKNIVNEDPMFFEISPFSNFSKLIKGPPAPNGLNKMIMGVPGIRYIRVRTTDKANPLLSPVVKVIVTTRIATHATDYAPKQEISRDNQQSIIKWITFPAVKKVKLEVANDAKFQNIILSKETIASAEVINKPVGTYYWRILPADNSMEYLLPSETKTLEVALPPVVQPIIAAQQILEYVEDSKGFPGYKIKLKPYVHASSYTIEVYTAPDLKKKMFARTSTSPIIFWERVRSGKYYYRIKIEDHWGRISEYSKVGELIFPISPLVEL